MKALGITRGHKTLGAKWLFEPRFSYQILLYLDSEVAQNTPTFHTAIRVCLEPLPQAKGTLQKMGA